MARQPSTLFDRLLPIPEVEALLNHSPLGYAFLVWPEMRYQYANEALARINGIPLLETLGRTSEEVLGPEMALSLRPLLTAAIAERQTAGEVEIQATLRGRPGQVSISHIHFHPVYPEAPTDAPLGIWFVVEDVTEQRRRDAESRHRQARLQAVMNTVPAGILLSDPDGNLIYANQEAERIWGHPLLQTDQDGYGHYELFHIDGTRVKPEESGLARILASGGGRISTNRLVRRPDGSWVPVLATSSLVHVEGENRAGGVVAFTDLTELKRLERRQQRLMDIAQAVNADIGLQDILRMVRDAVVEGGLFDRAGLWLYDEAAGGMRGSWGSDREGRPVDEAEEFFPLTPEGDHPLQQILRGDCRYHLTQEYTFSPQPSAGVDMQAVGPHATLPLCAHERVIGMLFVDNLITGRSIDEQDLTGLLPFCEQAALAIDSARLREAEHQKTAWLVKAVKVTNDRVKNNLQVIVAIIDTHLMEAKDAVVETTLKRIARQARAIAAVHDFLGDTAPDLAASIGDILETLLPMLETGSGINCSLTVDNSVLTIKEATAIALILNELISNAAIHGREQVSHVEVVFGMCEGGYRLTVQDDGPGFPTGFDAEAYAHRGLQYVNTLARWNLLGSVRYENSLQGGAHITVEF